MVFSTSLFQIAQHFTFYMPNCQLILDLFKVVQASFSIKTQLALLIYKFCNFEVCYPPCWSVLEKWSWIWQTTQAIEFKIDKKISFIQHEFSNSVFSKINKGIVKLKPLMNKPSKIIWPHCVTCHMDHHGLIAMSRISWDEFQNVKRKKNR